jgi:hypothetical protein
LILQLDVEPFAEELNLLLIRVNVVCPILHEFVELVAVVVDSVVPLLQIEELCQLAVHESRR